MTKGVHNLETASSGGSYAFDYASAGADVERVIARNEQEASSTTGNKISSETTGSREVLSRREFEYVQ